MEIKTERGLREENKQLTAELEELKGELEHALEKRRIAQGTAMERKKKIEKLEKKLEEVDVDFIRVVHAREVEKLQGRIDQLEQLCRDMYHVIYGEDTSTQTCEMFRQRMEQLGLLEGEQ